MDFYCAIIIEQYKCEEEEFNSLKHTIECDYATNSFCSIFFKNVFFEDEPALEENRIFLRVTSKGFFSLSDIAKVTDNYNVKVTFVAASKDMANEKYIEKWFRERVPFLDLCEFEEEETGLFFWVVLEDIWTILIPNNKVESNLCYAAASGLDVSVNDISPYEDLPFVDITGECEGEFDFYCCDINEFFKWLMETR